MKVLVFHFWTTFLQLSLIISNECHLVRIFTFSYFVFTRFSTFLDVRKSSRNELLKAFTRIARKPRVFLFHFSCNLMGKSCTFPTSNYNEFLRNWEKKININMENTWEDEKLKIQSSTSFRIRDLCRFKLSKTLAQYHRCLMGWGSRATVKKKKVKPIMKRILTGVKLRRTYHIWAFTKDRRWELKIMQILFLFSCF